MERSPVIFFLPFLSTIMSTRLSCSSEFTFRTRGGKQSATRNRTDWFDMNATDLSRSYNKNVIVQKKISFLIFSPIRRTSNFMTGWLRWERIHKMEWYTCIQVNWFMKQTSLYRDLEADKLFYTLDKYFTIFRFKFCLILCHMSNGNSFQIKTLKYWC